MAPDPKMEGFLNDENSISISNVSILSEMEAKAKYDIEPKPFARGKFAQVKQCINKSTSQDYAAKFIKKRRRCCDVTHEIFHEIRVLFLAIDHERIIQLYDIFETSNEFILILEMAPGGDLQRVLDVEDFLPENVTINFMRQILQGVKFLHQHNIAHLDIKPQNILLTEPYIVSNNNQDKGKDNQDKVPNIKLCDFGISRHILKGSDLREIVGTPDYVAPEVLHYEPISLLTDQWSLGCLTYVMLSGYSPFGAENKQETFCNITNGILEFPPHLFSNISSHAITFIQKLLVKNPKERMTCDEALGHEWLLNSSSNSNSCLVKKNENTPPNGSSVSRSSSPIVDLLKSLPEIHLKQQQDSCSENNNSPTVKQVKEALAEIVTSVQKTIEA